MRRSRGDRRAANGFSGSRGSGYGPVMVAASNSWDGMGLGRGGQLRRGQWLRLLLLPVLLLSLALGCLGCGPAAHAAPPALVAASAVSAVEITAADAVAKPTTTAADREHGEPSGAA